MTDFTLQNNKISPENVKMFDVVRLRHDGKNMMAVVLKRMYRLTDQKLGSLLVYPITPVHNPTPEGRAQEMSAGLKNRLFYYVSADKNKGEMGLDLTKDYKIAYDLNEAMITEGSSVILLGNVKASTATTAIKEAFFRDTQVLAKQDKRVLDAGTFKQLQGHATFNYESVASSGPTSWQGVGAAEPDKRLEPGKLKKRKEQVEPEVHASGPGTLYDLYTRSIAGQDITAKEPEAIIVAVKEDEPESVPVETATVEVPVEIVAEEAPAKVRKPRQPKAPADDITLSQLFRAGMISEKTRNVMMGSETQRAHALTGKNGITLMADEQPVVIKTLMQAYNYMAENDIRKIYGVGKATAETVEYEIKSAVEDLFGFDVK